MLNNKKNVMNHMPYGELVLMPLSGTEKFVKQINDYISNWREIEDKNDVIIPDGYYKESYISKPIISRFSSGEAKGTLTNTVRGTDVFIIVDVTNYSIKYDMFGIENHYSPDDHFQDLKRVIAAANGKAKRLNVIMPFLYESRQHKRSSRESLDCALMLQELQKMGVSNIITVDAHDPRVMNAIPLASFDSINCSYQFINTLLQTYDDLKLDSDNLMFISPDAGAMSKTIFYANALNLNVGMFYKNRDYTKIVDGKNPIVAHKFIGDSVAGKDVIIIDDMIASGDSLIDTASELKKRDAKRVFACCTFGLFTVGLSIFDKAYENHIIDKVFTTNCIYQSDELLNKPWYVSVDVTEYLARIIECLNNQISISPYLNTFDKINKVVTNYKLKYNNV